MIFSPKFTFVLSYGKKRVCSYVACENIHRKHVMPFSQPFFASEQMWSNVFDDVPMFPGSKKYPLPSGFQLSGFHLAPRLHLDQSGTKVQSRPPVGGRPGPWADGPGRATLTSTRHIFLAHYIAYQKDLHFCLIFVPYVRLSSCAFFYSGIHFIFISTHITQSRSTSNENAREYLPNGDNLFHAGCFAGSWRDIC